MYNIDRLNFIWDIFCFLIVSHIDAGDVCIHEVWAPTDCTVKAFRVKGGLQFLVTASKRVKYFRMELSQELPDMNGNFNNPKFSKQSKHDVKIWNVSSQNLNPDELKETLEKEEFEAIVGKKKKIK